MYVSSTSSVSSVSSISLLARIGSEIFATYSHRPNIRPSAGGGPVGNF